MKHSIILVLTLLSFSSVNANTDLSLVCFTEVSGGEEQLYVKTFENNQMAVYLESFSTPLTSKAPYIAQGDIQAYGYAKLTASLKDGSTVTLIKDYDETILDISNLKNVGLSDSRYMCYPII